MLFRSNQTYVRMKEHALDTRRLRLSAICTVCVRPFLNEIEKMNTLLDEIGPVARELPGQRVAHPQMPTQEQGAVHGIG